MLESIKNFIWQMKKGRYDFAEEMEGEVKYMSRTAYRCPVCSYIGHSEKDLENHIVERVDNKSYRGYDMNLPEIEVR